MYMKLAKLNNQVCRLKIALERGGVGSCESAAPFSCIKLAEN